MFRTHHQSYHYSNSVQKPASSYSTFLESDTQIYVFRYFMNLTWVVTLPLSNFHLH